MTPPSPEQGVERFRLALTDNAGGIAPYAAPHPQGQWVRFPDYEAERKRREAAERECIEQIDRAKEEANRHYLRAEQAEAKLKALEGVVEELERRAEAIERRRRFVFGRKARSYYAGGQYALEDAVALIRSALKDSAA